MRTTSRKEQSATKRRLRAGSTVLTCYALSHDVRHLAAGGEHPHA
jgi:hypothetical protein